MDTNDDGWAIAGTDRRKQKRDKNRADRRECPHMIRHAKANELERRLNVRGLADVLLGTTAKELQLVGWIYAGVIKPEDSPGEEEGYTYAYIDEINNYHDAIQFKQKKVSQE